VAGLLVLSGCGGSSTTSSVSPEQSDNAQRDVGYVRAINQIMGPFSKPPASMSDYAGATLRLRTAIRQLGALMPPRCLRQVRPASWPGSGHRLQLGLEWDTPPRRTTQSR
jgi:hypothetical protein